MAIPSSRSLIFEWKALGESSPLADFGRLRKTPDFFGNLRKLSCRLQKSQHSQDKNLTLISHKKLAGITFWVSYDACVRCVGWKQLPLHTHDVDKQLFALNSQNKQGWTYVENCIFVRHYFWRHVENKICQTSRPLSPFRRPLRAHFHQKRDVWVRGRGDLVITLAARFCNFWIAPCKGIRIRETRNFLLVDSGILGFGIRNPALSIRNPTKDWNPESNLLKIYSRLNWASRSKEKPSLESLPREKEGILYAHALIWAVEVLQRHFLCIVYVQYQHLQAVFWSWMTCIGCYVPQTCSLRYRGISTMKVSLL